MIGCPGYTDALSCVQYVNDIFFQKISILIILYLFSFAVIYYCRTNHYKKLVEEFISFKTFFLVPRWFAYVFIAFTFYYPFTLSITFPYEDFLRLIFAFVVPVVAWMSLLTFLLFTDWIFQRLGFENFKHFINSVWKK